MAYETITKGSTQRARWIPEGILETKMNNHGIVYIYQSKYGRLMAIAYAGAAGKSAWHYTFHQTPQGLDRARKVANEFLFNLEAHQQRKEAVKKQRSA